MSTITFAVAMTFTWLAVRLEVDNVANQMKYGNVSHGGERTAIGLSVIAIASWIIYHHLAHTP